MNRMLLACTVALAIAASSPLGHAAVGADSSVTMSGGSVGLFVGGNTGHGVLTFEGCTYPFTFRGLTGGDFGVKSITATGTVRGLKRVDNFCGNYTGFGAAPRGCIIGSGSGRGPAR